jgi:hypothetical protein
MLIAKERNWREGERGREHRRGDIISFESVIQNLMTVCYIVIITLLHVYNLTVVLL